MIKNRFFYAAGQTASAPPVPMGAIYRINTTGATTQIGSDTTWVYSRGEGDYGHAIKSDGTMWAIGFNHGGQTGVGTAAGDAGLSYTTQVGSGTDWILVSGNDSFQLGIGVNGVATFGIRSPGTLWSWGNGANNATGTGSTGNILNPVQLGSETDWIDVSSGGDFGVAVRENGTLWSWGRNAAGQTGQGTTSGNTPTPTQVGTDTDWLKVSASSFSGGWALGIKTDGTLWGWGSSYFNASGHGSQLLVPTQVGTDTDWLDVSTCTEHTILLKNNNTMWAIGRNLYGKTGQGTGTGSLTVPTQIGTDTDWVQISTSRNESLARKSNGTAWGFGLNSSGVVGSVGTEILVPTQFTNASTDYIHLNASYASPDAIRSI